MFLHSVGRDVFGGRVGGSWLLLLLAAVHPYLQFKHQATTHFLFLLIALH